MFYVKRLHESTVIIILNGQNAERKEGQRISPPVLPGRKCSCSHYRGCCRTLSTEKNTAPGKRAQCGIKSGIGGRNAQIAGMEMAPAQADILAGAAQEDLVALLDHLAVLFKIKMLWIS